MTGLLERDVLVISQEAKLIEMNSELLVVRSIPGAKTVDDERG